MRNFFSVLALPVLLACLMSINALALSDNKIEITDSSYLPQTLTVPVGTTVVWVNDDTAEHTVTGDDGTFRSGYLTSDERFSYRFDVPGNYPYHCSIHPSMQGMIQVTPESSGSYSALFESKRPSQDQKEDKKYAETAPETHITPPEKCEFCEMESSKEANKYVTASQFANDRETKEKAVPYAQYQTYAAQSEGNSLWIQGDKDWTKYAKVPLGSRLSLISISLAEGRGNLYETYPDGHRTKDDYYFYPYSQIGFYADTVGQHRLSFSAGDQESNSVVVDVIDGNINMPSYPEPVYQKQSYQKQSYQEQSYQRQGYQTQPAPVKDYSKDYDSFWKTSMVKMDGNGRLTYQGIQGTEFNLQPSNANMLTRGLLYNDASYILVANPNGLQNTVIVNPQLGNWNMQSVQVMYGNLMAAQIQNLLQITAPAYQSGVIMIRPMIQPPQQKCVSQPCAQPKGIQVQKKRYSFSVGPKPAYSFRAGPKQPYSSTGGRKQPYSFCAGPKQPYSFRVGY